MNDDIAISVENITKTYKPNSKYPTHALKSVSFDLRSNEVIGLIGPNGAGKTTLLKIILGYLKSDAGSVKIFGAEPLSKEVRQLIGFQADNQFVAKNVKVKSFLEFHSDLIGVPKNERNIDKLLEYFHLTPAAHKSLQALSKGMRQKIELIQAFLGSPKLVILDEPTAALDPISVFELRDYINAQKGKGLTILFSSHNLSEVEKVCDRVLFISEGVLFGDYRMSEVKPGFLETAFREYNETRRQQ